MNTVSFAVPSYVIPADTKENIVFLRDKVQEIALLCFEPSLPELADLHPFCGRWHIHLPYLVPCGFYKQGANLDEAAAYGTDTRWEDCWKYAQSAADIEILAKTCIQIVKHCELLAPHACVMHLPNKDITHAETWLDCFLQTWKKELPLNLLCLENVRNTSYFDYEAPLLGTDCSLCFDMAHALTYKQTACLDSHAFMQKVRVVHWSAPFAENAPEYGKDRHLNLNHLKNHKDYCIKVLKSTPRNATHVLELFSWEEIEKSKPFFFDLFSQS